MYVPWFLTLKKSYILPTEYLYASYVFQKKTKTFPYTALTDWFL